MSEPQVIDLFDSEEITYLAEVRHKYPLKEKMSGTRNWQWKSHDEVCHFLLEKLDPYIGKCFRHGGNYFETPNPFHPHTDTTKQSEFPNSQPYKNVVIPLTESPNIYTVVFEQRWTGPASHFWQGSLFGYLPDPLYNERKTDLIGVENVCDEPFPVEDYMKYLTHLPYESLQGFSILGAYPWKIGQALIFDCQNIHCGSNFRHHGINNKLGLSLFTSRYVE